MLQEELEEESQWKIYWIYIRNTNLSVTKKKIDKIEVPQKQGVFDPEKDLLTKRWLAEKWQCEVFYCSNSWINAPLYGDIKVMQYKGWSNPICSKKKREKVGPVF